MDKLKLIEQDLQFLSDAEIIRMVVGGSVVAFIILFIAYMIYITNLSYVLNYLKNKFIEILLPKNSNTWALYIIIYLQVIIFVISCFFQRSRSIAVFAVYGPTVSQGEIHRFFTSGLIHADVFHLYNNIRGLKSLGVILENTIGVVKFLTILLLTNTVGGIISFYLNPLSHYYGASGSIYGIIGGLFYVYYFRSKSFKDNNDTEADQIFNQESTMYFVRYILFGLIFSRISLFSSFFSFVIGFILCMALMGDVSRTRKQIIISITIFILAFAIGLTQIEAINNIDLELKSLTKCFDNANDKTQSFLTEEKLKDHDYYKKRNLAYEVQQYVVPLWINCLEDTLRVNTLNYSLIQKQKEKLDFYTKVFNSSIILWKDYAQLFQEEMNEILTRETRRKNLQFESSLKIHQNEFNIIIQEEEKYELINMIWSIYLILMTLTIIFVKSFPNLEVSRVLTSYWNYLVLYVLGNVMK